MFETICVVFQFCTNMSIVNLTSEFYMRWERYDKPKFSKDVELRMPVALDKEKAEDNQTQGLFNRGIEFSRFYWLQILSIRLSLYLSCFTFIFVPDDFAKNRSVISSKGKGKFVRARTGRSRSDRASRFAFNPPSLPFEHLPHGPVCCHSALFVIGLFWIEVFSDTKTVQRG